MESRLSSNEASSPTLSFLKKPSPLLLDGNRSESWKKFKRDLENFLIMSEKDDQDDQIKIAILKEHIGKSGLNLLDSFHLDKIDERKYDVILGKLEEHCCGIKNIVKERFEFLKTRQEGKSFDEFLATLASRISNCKYGNQEASILRDLIIVGLADTGIQKQLLQKTNITLDKTVQFVAERAVTPGPLASVLKSMNIIKRFLTSDGQFTDKDQNSVKSTTNGYSHRVLSNLENKGPSHDTSSVRGPLPLQLKGNLSENWKKFLHDFEHFLIKIEKYKATDRTKIAFLETYIGESGLELIDSFDLDKVDRGKYDLIISRLEEFCDRRINVVMERFKFLTSCQKEDESFDEFLANLREKISSCEYGDEEDSILRDLIICGLRDADIRESLLERNNITLKETIRYVKAGEESLRSYTEKLLEKKNARPSTANENSRSNESSSSQISRASTPQTSPASSSASTVSPKPTTPARLVDFESSPKCRQTGVDAVVPKEPSKSAEKFNLIENTVTVKAPSGNQMVLQQKKVAASSYSTELVEVFNSLSQRQEPPSVTHNTYNTYNTHNTYNTYNTVTPKNDTYPSFSSLCAIPRNNYTRSSLCSYSAFEEDDYFDSYRAPVKSRSSSRMSSEPVTSLQGIGKVYGGRLESMGLGSERELGEKLSSMGKREFKNFLRNEVGVRRDYADKCTADLARRRKR